MQIRVQLVSIAITGGLFLFVFELVRRKRLQERYALLWLFATALMLGLAVWRQGLEWMADVVGIDYAPSALFAVAFGFVLVILLHFSLVISRLANENKVLAQRLGMLSERVEALATEQPALEALAAPPESD
jgi:hypothetical protein